jgi:hypothetical protein
MFGFPLSKLLLPYNIIMGSQKKLEYPEESFPTLQPAFVVKVWGITSKYAAGNVRAGGGLFAVVCLGPPALEGRRAASMLHAN